MTYNLFRPKGNLKKKNQKKKEVYKWHIFIINRPKYTVLKASIEFIKKRKASIALGEEVKSSG